MKAAGIAMGCLAPRLAALAWFAPDASVFYYWDASAQFFRHVAPLIDGVVDTSIEPLYPALLALLRTAGGDSLHAAMAAQAVLGAAAGPLLFQLTNRLGGPRAAAIATTLYAIDPYLVRQSVSPVEITLCTALLVAAAWAYARGASVRWAAATGLLVALAILTRFSLAPIALGTIALMLVARRWTSAVCFTVAVALPVGAWMLRMHAVNGTVVPTRAGINLFVSTNDYAGDIVPLRNVDVLVPWAYETVAADVPPAGLTAPERHRALDDALFARAIAWARAHPRETLGLKLRNLAFTVAPVLLPLERKPRDASARIEGGRVIVTGLEPRPLVDHILYSASRLLLLVGAVAGLTQRRGSWHHTDGFLAVVAGTIIVVQTVFFPTSRLLATGAFVWMIWAGRGAVERLESRIPHP